ncbi:hypothetical protein Tco_0524542 [Tanacetum coccineum]
MLYHKTQNKACLSDYKDYNGGFVAFGSDPKGGKIMGKGKIRTANLDFDDVYFVDELKFNLFSVLQICDKKNSVLFTETEYLILSPSFKLLDESQVVLRAPRKDDVYSLDLKNIIPSGGTQDSYVAGSSRKDKESTQEYILLPLHPHRTRIPVEYVAPTAHENPSESFPKDNTVQDSEDVIAKALDDATRQAFEEEKRNIASQKRETQSTSTNKLSTIRSSVSTATTPYVSAASTPTDDSDAFLSDGIFNEAYDDGNDSSKNQILGDPKSAVQTRGKIQKDSSAQQALVSYISKQNRTNHKDHQNYLLACFLSQEEPKNISQAYKMEAGKAIQSNCLQFKLQKSTRIATTPIESNKPLVKDEDGKDVDVHVYISMIGSLMYLTASRPDIMFAVLYLC